MAIRALLEHAQPVVAVLVTNVHPATGQSGRSRGSYSLAFLAALVVAAVLHAGCVRVGFVGTSGQDASSGAGDDDARGGDASVPPDLGLSESWIASGHYTGTGVGGHRIDDVGFAPDAVFIKAGNGHVAAMRTSTMDGTKFFHRDEAALVPVAITGLTGEGFEIGTDAQVNEVDTEYYWVALRAVPGVMTVGAYTGDDRSGRLIATTGLTPTHVIVTGEHRVSPRQRFADAPVGISHSFRTTSPDADSIISFGADGFIIGDNAFINSTVGGPYHFLAFASGSPAIFTTSYLGDGQTERVIEGFGFTPTWVLVHQDGRAQTVQRSTAMPAGPRGTASFGIDAIDIPAAITALTADGIEIGSSSLVNEPAVTYFLVAFGEP